MGGESDPGRGSGRLISGLVYAGVVLVVGALYVEFARPWFEAQGEDALEWLSWVVGRAVRPRQSLVTADRLAVAVGLLSVFVFCTHLHAERRLSYRVALGAILLIGVGLRGHFALQDPLWIRRWPLTDDSHYYFNIAWNLAHGGGLRHDSFNLTTGFQPLFLLLITPISALAPDKISAVSAILWLQTGLGLALAIALTRLVCRVAGKAAALLAAGLWAFSLVFLEIDLNGLETGLSFLCVCCVCLAYIRLRESPMPPSTLRIAALGFGLGVAFLARVDNGLLAVAVGIHWIASDPWARPRSVVWRDIAILAGCTAILALPWIFLNLVLTGSPIPSGGQAVRLLSLIYGYRMLGVSGAEFDIASVPFPYYRATGVAALEALYKMFTSAVPFTFAVIAAVAGLVLGWKSAVRRVQRTAVVGTFLLLVFLAYTTYVFGQWFYFRYLTPFMLGYVLILASAFECARESTASRPRTRRVLESVVVIALATSLVSDVVSVIGGRARRIRGFYEAAVWMNENLPADAVVGGFQTGILGYFVERDFYGLDGKINQGALTALRESRIDEYIREIEIDYLVDWPFVLEELLIGRSADPGYLKRHAVVHSNVDVVVYDLTEALSEPSARGKKDK